MQSERDAGSRWVLTILGPLSLALLCATPDLLGMAVQSPAAQDGGGRTGPSSYVLEPDDQLLIHVIDVPEITDRPRKLDGDGDLSLPIVGRVHAAGMTVRQLEAELTQRLKAYVRDPDVSVTVAELRTRFVSVVGAVASAGAKQLVGQQTLVEVLASAGGLSADAGPTIRVSRRFESGPIPLPEAVTDPTGSFSVVDLDAELLLEGRNPDKNISIKANDIVSVPRADVVYVVGEVGRPGTVLLRGGRNLSVMEAVSASGGTLRTAAMGRLRILRLVEGQDTRHEIEVDLKDIMNGKRHDPAMVAGDILVVPDSTGKRAMARAVEAAVQMGILAASYGAVR